jgi:two-component system, NarL family, invasion response regulator UvrY
MHVLVVDDHAIVRRSLRNLLKLHCRGCTISSAASVHEAASVLQSVPVDLMILDMLLQDQIAVAHMRTWRLSFPQVRILVYSAAPSETIEQEVFALGCAGFLSKDSEEANVIDTIRTIMGVGVQSQG